MTGAEAGSVADQTTNQLGGRASFSQEGLWLQEATGLGRYELPIRIEVDATLDASAVNRGLIELIRDNPALRTSFVLDEDGDLEQVVTRGSPPFEMGTTDFRALSPSMAAQRVDERAKALAASPLDLARAPLLRAELCQLPASRSCLLLVVHHTVCDGTGVGLLLARLANYLDGTSGTSRAPAADEMAIEVAKAQRDLLASGSFEEEITFWSQNLAGLPDLMIPGWDPSAAERPLASDTLNFSTSRRLVDSLSCRRDSGVVSAFVVGLSAWFALLRGWSGQDDLAVISPVSTRSRIPDPEALGCFVNPLVIRADLQGAVTLSEVVEIVRSAALDALEFQDLPFEFLLREVMPRTEGGRPRLFRAHFAMAPDFAGPESFSGAGYRIETPTGAFVNYEVSLYLKPRENQIDAVLEFARDAVTVRQARDLAGRYGQMMALEDATVELEQLQTTNRVTAPSEVPI